MSRPLPNVTVKSGMLPPVPHIRPASALPPVLNALSPPVPEVPSHGTFEARFSGGVWKTRDEMRAGLGPLAARLADDTQIVVLHFADIRATKPVDRLKEELARRQVAATVVLTDGTARIIARAGSTGPAGFTDGVVREEISTAVRIAWQARCERLILVLRKAHPQRPESSRLALIALLERDGLSARNSEYVEAQLRPLGMIIPPACDVPAKVDPFATGLSPDDRRRIVTLDPRDLAYSQATVRSLVGPHTQVAQLGGLRALQVVDTGRRRITFDNSRVAFAVLAGVREVEAIVRESAEGLPKGHEHRTLPVQGTDRRRMAEYLHAQALPPLTPRGEARVRTWGEAVTVRSVLAGLSPEGSFEIPRIRDTELP